ncbi:uncharacterized protein TNCV_3661041 [Trichonephila clavipes]|nr:uncharacterized protein TNCV_3661041 [Trichonephila clavipes]
MAYYPSKCNELFIHGLETTPRSFGFSPIDRTCVHYSAIADDRLVKLTLLVKISMPQQKGQNGISIQLSQEGNAICRLVNRYIREGALVFAKSSSGQSFIPANLGRVDEELIPQGWGVSQTKTSVENVEFCLPIQHNLAPDPNSRTIVTVSFLDVTGMKPCPKLSPNQLALRTAFGTEIILIRKEDMTSLMSCPLFVLLTLL